MSNVEQGLKPWTEFLAQLGGREHRRALRGPARKVGNKVRKVAVSNLHSSGLKVGPAADSNIRLQVYSRRLGFAVSVAARGSKKQREAVMYTNSRGLKKPVLMWAESGTAARRTKDRTKFFVRLRRGHSTGAMQAYGFLAAAERSGVGIVERDFLGEVEKSAMRVARKAGLK